MMHAISLPLCLVSLQLLSICIQADINALKPEEVDSAKLCDSRIGYETMIAAVDGRIIALCFDLYNVGDRPTSCRIYDTNPLVKLDEIPLPFTEATDQRVDMFAAGGAVYFEEEIRSTSELYIWKYDLESKQTIVWKKGPLHPSSTTVSDVTGRVTSIAYWPDKHLILYNADGTWLRNITLSADIEIPGLYKAYESPTGTFFLTQLFQSGQGIMEVDGNGQLLATYDGKLATEDGDSVNLYDVAHVAFEKTGGDLLVVDSFVSAVGAVAQPLDEGRLIVGSKERRDASHNPVRMAYDRLTGLLGVVMQEGTTVLYSL